MIRVALSMYLRSPAAYNAFTQTGVVKLPSGRLLQSYVRDRAQGVGADEHNGKLMREVYARHKLLGAHKAAAAEAQAATIANTRTVNATTNSTIIIITTTTTTATTATPATSAWTSVGPFSSGGVSACFWEALVWFSRYGFCMHEVICDAASANVKFIKMGCPHADVFSDPRCLNPFSGRDMFFILDPEHMLKSLRSALFSSGSQDEAAKRFLLKTVFISWSFVKEAYQRDMQRQARGQFRLCPKTKRCDRVDGLAQDEGPAREARLVL